MTSSAAKYGAKTRCRPVGMILGVLFFLWATEAAPHSGNPSEDPINKFNIGYEPCHLLCSIEAGRVEARSTGAPWERQSFGLRLATVYMSPLGEYEKNLYRPLESGASVHAVQFLNGLWWRPQDWLQINLGMPWEYNRADEVVLPTLHPTDQPSEELEPGGVYASVLGRLPLPRAWRIEAWMGLGYRLSSPVGTVDVSESLADFPDKGVEALGVGSDDSYLLLSTLWRPENLRKWGFGAGAELRIHHLPRFETLFATTGSYRLSAYYFLSPRWSASVSLSGFTTAIHTIGISQTNGLIVTPSLRHVFNKHW